MTDEGPILDQINVVVRDMEAMVAFYERLGVPVPGSPAPWEAWDPHHRTADAGSVIDLDLDSQAFASVWNQGWPADGTGVVLGFRLPDRDAVDRAYTELTTAGYTGQQEPYDAFWGARYAVVEDPDGNSVGLMSPADPDRRQPGPPPPD